MNNIKTVATASRKAALLVLTVTFTFIANAKEKGPDSASREAHRAAFEDCMATNNLSRPEPGQEPSEADRETMKTCMAEKGFDMPPPGHHRRHRHGPPSGERPANENAGSGPQRSTSSAVD